MKRAHDNRIVLTLDAGGTHFRFAAMRGFKRATPTVTLPSHGGNLNRCLAQIVKGFALVKKMCPAAPVAISFAFPGPADYPNGVIGDLPNLPGFRGGVALGPMLEREFRVPVFINNDGGLFAYGEAVAGFLPHVNGLLEKAGRAKRYHNLLGVTLGAGFGGGIVCHGQLLTGDNASAGHVWLLRHKLRPEMNADEGVSIRAVRRGYAERAGLPLEQAPSPKMIGDIARGRRRGHKTAAREAFRQLGEVLGDALGQALALVDGLAVIGGGLSGAAPLFWPAMMEELNGFYTNPAGKQVRRLASQVFNLGDPAQLKEFLAGETPQAVVPASGRKVKYEARPRVGIGLSRLGTSEAVAIGACAFALHKIGQR